MFTRYKASTHLQWDVSGLQKSNVDSLDILIRLLLQACIYIIGNNEQWRIQKNSIGWAKPVGRSGGMLPQENFEIETQLNQSVQTQLLLSQHLGTMSHVAISSHLYVSHFILDE